MNIQEVKREQKTIGCSVNKFNLFKQPIRMYNNN